MDVYIELLHGGIDVQALLRDYGWRLDKRGADRLTARHPLVSDQEDARNKLFEAGLLTSRYVRIEFASRPTPGMLRGWPQ